MNGMNKRFLLGVGALLVTLMFATFTASAVAYKLPPCYGGTPIRYGGWVYGQVTYQSARFIIQGAVWAQITISNDTYTALTTTKSDGWYRVYIPPGDYTLTVKYAQYEQSCPIHMNEDQVKLLLNIYIQRPEMGFKDRLAS